MQLPHWISRKSWRQGDRVVVAYGTWKGTHGSVYIRAEPGSYLVELDNGRTEKFKKGALDPE
jgi:hypothetical protein